MWLESEHETKRGKKIYMEIGQDKKNKSTQKKKKGPKVFQLYRLSNGVRRTIFFAHLLSWFVPF